MTGPSSSSSSQNAVATGGRRAPPHPNSILNRKDLLAALDDANITLKQGHVMAFYQSLHRLGYPSLQEFVKIYYEQEEEALRWNKTKSSMSSSNDVRIHNNNNNITNQHLIRPLKNNISQSKNRNRLQLPKPFLDFLETTQNFVTVTSNVYQAVTSADGSTTKLAVQLYDGQLVESVIMRYTAPGEETSPATQQPPPRRASLCVSSQVGCAMGCTFCATATMGIRGNLTTGEILEQLVHADKFLAEEGLERRKHYMEKFTQEQKEKGKQPKINPPPQVVLSRNLDLVRNVVFMGMGEPLNNYDNVVEACRAMLDRRRWNLAHGRVTVSTVGVTPRMKDLTRDLPEVSLALSLHAPNQAMRSKIVPAAKNYPIEGLIEAMDQHMLVQIYKQPGQRPTLLPGNPPGRETSTRRRAMIEYVMLEGDTSSFECAHQLGKLCENRQVVVNLIPYNQTDVRDQLRYPSEEHIKEFQRIVTSYGTFCSIRRTMGADIASACGQLVVKKEKKKGVRKEQPQPLGDLEDGPFAKSSNNFRAPSTTTEAATSSNRSTRLTQAASSSVIESAASTASSQLKPSNLNNGEDDRIKSLNELERWIQPLAVSTALAATCFVVSSVLFLRQRRR